MKEWKAFAAAIGGTILVILLYQAYLDHRWVRQTCENLATATAGKFVCK